MFPILHLGPLAIQLPGLLLLVGVWLGTTLIDREAARRKLSAAVLNNLVFYSLIAGILGARLGYALRFLSVYLENPLDIFSLNPNTLSTFDGIAAAALTALVYGYRRELPLWPALDALTPSLAVLAVFVGLAHVASGDAFGSASSVPWAIELWGERRHPTQIYEVALAGLIFAGVMGLRSRKAFSGFLFLAWVALTAAARLILEAFRGDSLIVLDRFRIAQPISLIVVLLALTGLHLLARGSPGRNSAARR